MPGGDGLKIAAPIKKRSRPNGIPPIPSVVCDSIISPNREPSISPTVSTSSSRAVIVLGNLHQSLRRVLNVHPEKYRKNSRQYSRSASPFSSSQMAPARSRSIDDELNRRLKNARGSLTQEYSGVTTLKVPDETCLLTLNDADLEAFPDELLCPNGGDYIFTDDEDDPVPREIITINVSGLRFQTQEKTLKRYPETILGNPFKRKKYYIQAKNEFFFDRHRACFESILHIYQSRGQVVRPENIPIDVYLNELKFHNFSGEVLETFWANEGYVKPPDPKMPENFIQRSLWELMEYPDSSLAARIFAFVSIAVIILKPEEVFSNREWNSGFFWVEFICSVWFSIELILRFLGCPEKIAFCKSFLNILDFVAVAPFFVNMIWFADSTTSSMSFSVLRIIRLVRVFRIFKLSRHSVGLQVLGKTFKASIREFFLLIFFLGIALVLFSSGVYFAEQGESNTKFTSIPASFWFVLATLSTVGYGDMATLSTVGYGDMVPTGVYGKIVGGCCSLIGVITLALPVPIIVANFKHFYRQEIRLAQMYNLAQQDNASNASKKSFNIGA
uniref:BTB domain-containing protein n=1 Tax=Panagrolaimus sp. PS1159 TaxID=55785 RepID=A0AC35FTK8_9BILA